MAVGAALVFGGYSIFMKKLSAYDYHIIELTQRVFLYGLLFMVPALFLFDFHFDLSRFSSASNILNMLFLGIGASALCFATWNYSVGVLGAVKSSAYIYMVPVITITAAILILHENMTWIALLGGALTLLGLYISELKLKPKAKLMGMDVIRMFNGIHFLFYRIICYVTGYFCLLYKLTSIQNCMNIS